MSTICRQRAVLSSACMNEAPVESRLSLCQSNTLPHLFQNGPLKCCYDEVRQLIQVCLWANFLVSMALGRGVMPIKVRGTCQIRFTDFLKNMSVCLIIQFKVNQKWKQEEIWSIFLKLLFPLPQVVTGFQVQMHVYDIDHEIGIIMSQKGCIHLIKTTVNIITLWNIITISNKMYFIPVIPAEF